MVLQVCGEPVSARLPIRTEQELRGPALRMVKGANWEGVKKAAFQIYVSILWPPTWGSLVAQQRHYSSQGEALAIKEPHPSQ